jgi:threonine dehydrogenase-like Zn-dependent dehydrogenase
MRGVVMHAPGDVRVEDRPEPTILKPTDAIIRLPATCICGSDLWPYRGFDEVNGPSPMGHEYVGIVEEVGTEVTTIKSGQFVIGSFFASDNTCEICQAGYQSSCVNRVGIGSEGAQAELLQVPLADGTLVPTPEAPADDLIPDFLALSDVLGTG